MKLAIALTHAEVIASLTATVLEQFPDATVGDFTFAVDGDGQVTAHAQADNIGSGASTESADAKPARTRSGRGSRNQAEEAPVEEETKAEAPKTTRRRGSTAQAETPAEETEAPKATRTRRGSTPKPVAPTVPTKSEDDYTQDEEGNADEADTYWASVEVPHDAFVVPAGQILPSAEEYDELASEEEALERIAEAPAQEVAEAKPTRTRRGGATKQEDPAAEEATATAPAGRKRLFNRK